MLLVVLAITIVGLIVVVPAAIALPAVLLFCFVAVAALLGQLILSSSERYRDNVIVAAIVGAVLVSLVSLVPVIGGLVVFVATVVGFGAALMLLNEWRQARRPALLPPAARSAGRMDTAANASTSSAVARPDVDVAGCHAAAARLDATAGSAPPQGWTAPQGWPHRQAGRRRPAGPAATRLDAAARLDAGCRLAAAARMDAGAGLVGAAWLAAATRWCATRLARAARLGAPPARAGGRRPRAGAQATAPPERREQPAAADAAATTAGGDGEPGRRADRDADRETRRRNLRRRSAQTRRGAARRTTRRPAVRLGLASGREAPELEPQRRLELGVAKHDARLVEPLGHDPLPAEQHDLAHLAEHRPARRRPAGARRPAAAARGPAS